MGLASGDHGVKKTCKEIFSDSYRDFGDLVQARTAVSKSAKQTCVILDGNVLLKSIPLAMWSLQHYDKLFTTSIKQAFKAADTVIVIFDDGVTKAKAFEQDRRDKSRAKRKPVVSADMREEFCPTTDEYTVEQIDETVNVHYLYDERAARPRLIDILCKRAMEKFLAEQKSSVKRWTTNGSDPAATQTLVFDGVDCRGGDRPFGTPREGAFYCSDPNLDDRLERKLGEHVGEGDVKFTDLQRRIADLKEKGKAFTEVELVILSTVDTDSIGIELMRIALESYRGVKLPFDTLLAFRERPPKRKADEGADVLASASYSTFHTRRLYDLVLVAIFGDGLEATKHIHPHAMFLLVTLWVLGGSDFAKQPGMRSDISIEAVCSIASEDLMMLQGMAPVLKLACKGSDTTEDEIMAVKDGLLSTIEKGVRACAQVLAETPRLKASSHKASNFFVTELKKASFVTLYWAIVNENVLDKKLTSFGF